MNNGTNKTILDEYGSFQRNEKRGTEMKGNKITLLQWSR